MFGSLFQRRFAMVSMDALAFQWAAAAILAAVPGHPALEACPAFADEFICSSQFPSLGTEVHILVCQIGHVLFAADVFLPFSGLALLIVVGLDEGTLPIRFKVKVILFALISGIGNHVEVTAVDMLFHVLQERNERGGVCRLWSDCCPCYEFRICAALDVVGRLELTVFHGIFLHAHESGISICLGKAVAAAQDVQVFMVFLEPRNEVI